MTSILKGNDRRILTPLLVHYCGLFFLSALLKADTNIKEKIWTRARRQKLKRQGDTQSMISKYRIFTQFSHTLYIILKDEILKNYDAQKIY